MSGYLDRFVADRAGVGPVVQPRMGFGTVSTMRSGLARVAALDYPVVGTLTLDSYTRVGDYTTPLQRLAAGEELNGYPIVSHPVERTAAVLAGLYGPAFPVQVRHGTALPLGVFRRLVELGLDATEGGPVSYCLPYSRVPLRQAVRAWAVSCRFLADHTERGHIESFGGCLLGQLCPPSLLVAMGVLEGCFFRRHGLRHMSFSYAQGTSAAQDRGALRALRALAATYLGDVTWHVVLYTYMGLFPRTPDGAELLIRDSARLARDAGCERLIVKTVSEAWQIPSIAENVAALRLAATEIGRPSPTEDPESGDDAYFEEILDEARTLIDAVLDLAPDVGDALVEAFASGLLDVPYCLHTDNAGAATCVIDDRGALRWGALGRLPLPRTTAADASGRLGSDRLYAMLEHVANRYDSPLIPPRGNP
ncbi:Methylaspartate mutase E chain [Nocardia otitidiscaviarum]|uniref:Methylaspartate mutase E chain n=1 Tax=Nocardia otitidiscaviarum TaxID=1823 RepID=A0A378YLG0_9NOCA|nr:methylaspartate mutase [Nocardia otitidiscaviarum]MBF6181914.1 methylaspartate mutase [Nocardia otitidiscaviarum]SUA78025.1 Methylaspartate mutase E chain [Nocardia otitidiscaviarum]